ncbi:APC family permease [Streptomyces vietnamensis]|uniref:APC family permease n=1 Tax=Streptomyces vietnamensis TaxID=362257 RepID=UPI00099B2CF9|nr:APC family permease [Streptomyces vietnamensis]
MPTRNSTSTPQGSLDAGAMGTADIVFFVLGGVAPMGVSVAWLPLAIALGNGPGAAGTYLIAGVILALFSVGYVRMSRRIANVGGFYIFAREGLGRRAGGATAYVALLAYNAATIGIFGSFAYFSSHVFTELLGTPVPWQLSASVGFVIVAVLSYFEVTTSAKVLGVALVAEVLTLLGLDAAILIERGFKGFSLEVFEPSVVLGSGFGVSLMFAFGSFVGFEATALYGEEARNPRRSVPRATYISLTVITVFYLLTTWAAISATGVDHAQSATKADPENYIFDVSTNLLGQGYTEIMGILVMTSLFAAFLAFHFSTSRYHVALARDGLLPQSMARIHPKHGSPVTASAWQLGLLVLTTCGFTLAGQHPYLGMSISLFGLGVLGIVLLQGIAAVSIVGFFLRRHHRQDESIWGTLMSPALGALGLVGGLVLMIDNYSTLTGTSTTWVNALPWALPAAAVIGAFAAGRSRITTAEEEDRVGVTALHTTKAPMPE